MKTNRLLSAVALTFAISWLPLNIFNLVVDSANPFGDDLDTMLIIYAVCHLCGMSSACVNPLLYGWLNVKLRQEIVLLIRCCSPANQQLDNAPPSNRANTRSAVWWSGRKLPVRMTLCVRLMTWYRRMIFYYRWFLIGSYTDVVIFHWSWFICFSADDEHNLLKVEGAGRVVPLESLAVSVPQFQAVLLFAVLVAEVVGFTGVPVGEGHRPAGGEPEEVALVALICSGRPEVFTAQTFKLNQL